MAVFDNLAKQASALDEKKRAEMLLILMANLSSHFRFELGEAHTLDREQTAKIISDSLQEVKD